MSSAQPLLHADQLLHEGIQVETGDVGVVIKPDGSFRVFTTGMETVTVETLTDAQRQQGRRLIALSLLLGNEDVMTTVLELADDSGVVNQERAVAYGSQH